MNYAMSAAYVKGLREKLGLSQREFAERFGFNVRSVEEWECGRHRPNFEAARILAGVEKETSKENDDGKDARTSDDTGAGSGSGSALER